MYLRFNDNSPEGLLRVNKIKDILPKDTLVNSILIPKIDSLYPTFLKMLYSELEVYRAYPKKPLEDSGRAKAAVKTFDARNHTTCFQGKAFDVKDHTFDDAELRDYRKAIGTLNHREWGNVTLMEIWGGDHMKDYPEMVKQAFKYGSGIIKNRPVLKFYVNPLYLNESSGALVLTDEQKIYKYDQDLLLAKAVTWGVRTPEEVAKVKKARTARSEKQQAKLDAEYLENRKKVIGV